MTSIAAVRFGAVYQLKGLDETRGKQLAEAAVKTHGALGKGTAAWFQQPGEDHARTVDTFLLTFQDAADYLSLKQGILAAFPESQTDELTAQFREDALAGLNRGFVEGKKGATMPIEMGPIGGSHLLLQA